MHANASDQTAQESKLVVGVVAFEGVSFCWIEAIFCAGRPGDLYGQQGLSTMLQEMCASVRGPWSALISRFYNDIL